MIGLFRRWFGAPTVSIGAPTLNDARKMAAIHQSSFHRGWSEREFEDMLASPNALLQVLRVGRRVDGFVASRIAADEAEILSIALADAARGRGWSRRLLETHLGHLAGRGARRVFLEVEEGNAPALRLYRRAGFREVGRRAGYYAQADGGRAHALILRRDLS